MRTSRAKRVGAILVGLTLVAAACGSDDDGADEGAETTDAPESTDAEGGGDGGEAADGSCETDGVLTIGTILPVTGDLAFLGPPEVAGADLAVQDINAAGGVLGADVVLEQGDSGDTTTDTANLEVDRLLAAGSDVIVGAASSAVSKTVIDKITGSCVIQFCPANTSPDFTTYDDNGLYFRTAPSDLLQGRVLANLVLEDGAETASVLYRQESYGVGLAEAFQDNFTSSGGTIDEFLAYAVDTESFDAEVDTLVEAGSDAIVVIGFAECASILTTMNERGIGPADMAVYGVDGNIGVESRDVGPVDPRRHEVHGPRRSTSSRSPTSPTASTRKVTWAACTPTVLRPTTRSSSWRSPPKLRAPMIRRRSPLRSTA